MAELLKADGTVEQVSPANGNKWSLDELQRLVGGFIEAPPWLAPLRMVWNEDGGPRGLPVNQAATDRVLARLQEKGGALRYIPTIRGDVVVLAKGEKF